VAVRLKPQVPQYLEFGGGVLPVARTQSCKPGASARRGPHSGRRAGGAGVSCLAPGRWRSRRRWARAAPPRPSS